MNRTIDFKPEEVYLISQLRLLSEDHQKAIRSTVAQLVYSRHSAAVLPDNVVSLARRTRQ